MFWFACGFIVVLWYYLWACGCLSRLVVVLSWPSYVSVVVLLWSGVRGVVVLPSLWVSCFCGLAVVLLWFCCRCLVMSLLLWFCLQFCILPHDVFVLSSHGLVESFFSLICCGVAFCSFVGVVFCGIDTLPVIQVCLVRQMSRACCST